MVNWLPPCHPGVTVCEKVMTVLCFLKDCFGITCLFIGMSIFLFFAAIFTFLCALMRFLTPNFCKSERKLDGKIVMITGGGGAVGRALAMRAAKYKAVVIVVDLNEEQNQQTMKLVKETYSGTQIFAFTANLSDRDAVFALARRIQENIGDVELLINNAAIAIKKELLNLSKEDIDKTINCNLMAHFWTVQAFLPAMMQRNFGNIVAISSIGGLVGTSKLTDYCAAKFGVIGLMESLQVELDYSKKNGIKLTTVCPWLIFSPLFETVYTKLFFWLPRLKPTQVAEEVINAIRYEEELVLLPPLLKMLVIIKTVLPSRIARRMGFALGAHTAMNS